MSIIHIAFYPSDWLAGTRGMTAEETGVYITLVARMYEMAGPIARDDQRLARLCGCKTKSAFAKVLDYLISEGKITETKDGLFQERVQKEIKNTTEKSDKAKAAAQSRWDRKPNKNNGGINADASAKHMPQGCQSEPESYKKEITNVILSDGTPAIDEISEALRHFNATAKTVGWPEVQKLTPPRRAAILGRLKDIGGLDGWIEAINRAASAPHLIGNNDRGWYASFDWLTKPANFTKLMEGNYDPRSNSNSGSGANSGGRRGSHDSLMAGFAESANQGRG